MFKKILAFIIGAAILTGALTSCGDDESPEDENENSNSVSEDLDDYDDLDNAEDFEEEDEEEDDDDLDVSEASDSSVNLEALYEAAIGAVKFPVMVSVEDIGGDASEYIGDKDMYEDYIVEQAGISSIFVYLIIAEAKDGEVDDALNALTDCQEKLNDASFYPQGVEAAAASIVGNSGNIVYLICHKDAAIIEEAMLFEVNN